MASNNWIAWGSEEKGRVRRERLIGIFALLSGGSSFFILGRAVLLSTIAIETAQHLVVGMIRSILRAPLSFFDSTPSSRIRKRSSTDQSIVDTHIPYRDFTFSDEHGRDELQDGNAVYLATYSFMANSTPKDELWAFFQFCVPGLRE
ncbi:ABC transporter C family member 5-like isoform X3 [Primulina eburnea]|uniref:ABC transporter C family member 5-like isoform X3 n=1 Tax=Primulina eburnea TaxID=1245227 RepID=UPI003C6BF1F6